MKFSRMLIGSILAVVMSITASEPSIAMSNLGGPAQALSNSDFQQVVFRRGVGGGGARMGGGGRANINMHRHGNLNVNRNINVNRRVGVARGVYRGGAYRGVWVGRSYGWAPGAAIAVGAAIGFVSYATALAWAPPPPQPGLCWYYKDASRRNGFWDSCP